MSENDTALRVGQLTTELAARILDLKRARSDANRLAPDLRVLADCFDSRIQGVSMTDLDESGFTFRATKDRKEIHARRSLTTKRIVGDGNTEPVAAIPDGTALVDLARRIRDAKQEAERLLSELRDEGVDLRGICEALDCD